ncbi:DUF2510 domain-containing protein [Demequina sp. B12]|uniref:DUF2510 domain-containing protein n=1 Tax=Demequina sp. B12 TaxID=2992757 RepID=UPI00237A8F56|nr:DUF2510 domain-containing protein [Demequina sp. B12]MDE0572490.1 DUF2510 domain-containing protein [Demequina sp. B12]
MTGHTPPGWYDDPHAPGAGSVRFWDGSEWTAQATPPATRERHQPAPATTPAAPACATPASLATPTTPASPAEAQRRTTAMIATVVGSAALVGWTTVALSAWAVAQSLPSTQTCVPAAQETTHADFDAVRHVLGSSVTGAWESRPHELA